MTRIYASETVEMEIPFHDIDIMGIAWHGHYAKYLEIARCAMLETIDYNVSAMQASGFSWPVIEMHVRYSRPLQFQQKIQVETNLVEIENRLKINYRIFDVETGQRITKAHTIQVAFCMKTNEMLFASPAVLLDKFQQ
jgi:acyl-CoA thioester hydrolase